MRSCLKLQDWVKAIPSERQRYTYQKIIREYLGIKSYDKKAQKMLAIFVAAEAEIKDHPADLINVAIEKLVQEKYEVSSIFEQEGGAELLLQKYEEIAAYNTNNHLPLVWRFYAPHRKALFDLVRSLDIHSTSADEERN